LKEKDEESMEEVERKHIQRVLNSCDGNRTHAAKKLGLNVRTLRNKIKEYDLES
jgi:DNA-binding protein Fis